MPRVPEERDALLGVQDGELGLGRGRLPPGWEVEVASLQPVKGGVKALGQPAHRLGSRAGVGGLFEVRDVVDAHSRLAGQLVTAHAKLLASVGDPPPEVAAAGGGRGIVRGPVGHRVASM